jgi:hypothetical protein
VAAGSDESLIVPLEWGSLGAPLVWPSHPRTQHRRRQAASLIAEFVTFAAGRKHVARFVKSHNPKFAIEVFNSFQSELLSQADVVHTKNRRPPGPTRPTFRPQHSSKIWIVKTSTTGMHAEPPNF